MPYENEIKEYLYILLILIINKMKRTRETKQKQIIENAVLHFSSFFNAEELHLYLKKKDKEVGIATIYRLLTILVSEGKIHSYFSVFLFEIWMQFFSIEKRAEMQYRIFNDLFLFCFSRSFQVDHSLF